MNLVSMKMSEEEKAEQNQPTYLTQDPEYPYGLIIRLDEEALKKLGIEGCEPGDKYKITAEAVVKTENDSIDSKGERETEVGLQITAMAMEHEGASHAEAVQKLYGG